MNTLHDYNGNEYQLKDKPLWYHTQGLMPTASGYGAKLVTPYKAFIQGKWRRVYCTQYSNAGSLWVVVNKQKLALY